MEKKFEGGEPLRLTLEEVNVLAYVPTEHFKEYLKKIGLSELTFAREWSLLQRQLQFVSFMGFRDTKIKLTESQKLNAVVPLIAYRKSYAESEEEEVALEILAEKVLVDH